MNNHNGKKLSNKPPKPNDNPWRAAALVSAIGADLVFCILAGYFGGSWLSSLTGGHKGWIAGGVISGLVVGIIGIFFLIKRLLEEDARE